MERPPRCLEKGLGLGRKWNTGYLRIPEEGIDNGDREEASRPKLRLYKVPKERSVPSRRSLVSLAVCIFVVTTLFQIDPRLSPCHLLRATLKAWTWLPLCDTWVTDGDDYLNDCSNVLTKPEDLSNDSRKLHDIPQYVLDYAPLVHLYSEEQFWPCDIAEHLFHITPELNYTPIQGRTQDSNLTNLNDLNEFEQGRHVYLTSNDNVEERPDWLGGQKNIPDEFGEDEEKVNTRRFRDRPKSRETRARSHGGRSAAPAVLVTVNKGHGIVDAFWFYFYSYNLGNIVFNIRFGNHIGDWEHSLIRFQHGVPKLVFYSEHYFGEAYNYSAVEKIGKRVSIVSPRTRTLWSLTKQKPVVYSATGTHAMYATPGSHPYVLPLGILHDETDRGPLWDPALNSHMYTYNHLTDDLRASNVTPHAPTEWFYFNGHWGDRFYPLNDARQYGFFGEYHYVSGPLGPRFKHLGRRKVCQGRYSDPCVIKDRLDADNEVREWPGLGEGEDWPDPEMSPPGRVG